MRIYYNAEVVRLKQASRLVGRRATRIAIRRFSLEVCRDRVAVRSVGEIVPRGKRKADLWIELGHLSGILEARPAAE